MTDIKFKNGVIKFNGKKYQCVAGKNGAVLTEQKREGDGATPAGSFTIRKVLFRTDKIAKPESPFETAEISTNDGWCDDINDLNYNKLVKLPYPASHENLWREDNIYDIIAVLGHNDNPVAAGKGSAIFMHIARPEFTATDGCLALSLPDLLEILKNCRLETKVIIEK